MYDMEMLILKRLINSDEPKTPHQSKALLVTLL